MPAAKIRKKWRPTLAHVMYAVLLSVLALPIVIIILFNPTEHGSANMAPMELGAFALALALTLLIAYVLTRAITSPINALMRRTDEIARGGRSAIKPLDSYGTREIATLTQSFLDLAEDLVDRTDYVRSFATHVSHELKSPLTAIRGAGELLRDDDADTPMTTAQRQQFLDNIIADADRLDRLLVRLRELAYAESPVARGETDMSEIVSQLSRRFPMLTIKAESAVRKRLALPQEAANIVFANLAENALQHGANHLDVSVRREEKSMIVLIADNGTGVSDGNENLIFRPLFSTRREYGGTGMGLSIVRAMLASHGATISLTDSNNNGATFEIKLPLSS
jgi:signal transduction histidine kinase